MWGNKSLNKPIVVEVIKCAKLFYQITVNFTFWVLVLMSASAYLHTATHTWLMLHVLWPSKLERTLNNTFISTVSSLTCFAFSIACTDYEYQMSTKTCIFHYCGSCQSWNCYSMLLGCTVPVFREQLSQVHWGMYFIHIYLSISKQ
jgi:hypothetical protein